jgi:hypothetical protein
MRNGAEKKKEWKKYLTFSRFILASFRAVSRL